MSSETTNDATSGRLAFDLLAREFHPGGGNSLCSASGNDQKSHGRTNRGIFQAATDESGDVIRRRQPFEVTRGRGWCYHGLSCSQRVGQPVARTAQAVGLSF